MRDNETHQLALAKAIEWLHWAQDRDGSWKSQTYGGMKQGAALTSLVLYALSHLPEKLREQSKPPIERGLDFLTPGIEKRNQVANADGSLDNPVYATAMYLTTAKNLGLNLDNKLRNSLVDFLLRSQVDMNRGFPKSDPNHGGWDVLGPDVKPGKTAGPNISVTRFVLDALKPFLQAGLNEKLGKEQGLEMPLQRRLVLARLSAPSWMRALSNSGEGSTFSSQPNTALNKARSADGKAVPYGSATCDLLLACDKLIPTKSGWFQVIANWIKVHSDVESVPGFEAMQPKGGWEQGLYFYYAQSLARALLVLREQQWAQERLGKLADVLCIRQQEGGFFQNPVALMREDDPIIATSFAVIALAAAVQ